MIRRGRHEAHCRKNWTPDPMFVATTGQWGKQPADYRPMSKNGDNCQNLGGMASFSEGVRRIAPSGLHSHSSAETALPLWTLTPTPKPHNCLGILAALRRSARSKGSLYDYWASSQCFHCLICEWGSSWYLPHSALVIHKR